MFDVYAFATPNSIKVPIALEELGLDYTLHAVNVRHGEQKAPDLVALNPNAKVPVLIDPDAEGGRLVLTESAAILVYLAEKTGRLARGAVPDFPGTLVPVDLSDQDATGAVLADLTSRFAFDGAVNNVGLVRPQKLGTIELSALEEVMRVNLYPALQLAQALLPGMAERGWGRIVNISSLTILGAPERTAYAAAKAALVSFSRSWALELATTGITVNAVAPGPTETELFRANNPPGSEGEKRYLTAVPMQRFGSPDEIAAAIAFLLSDEAGFITGQTIHVDGGASIGKAAF